MSDNSNIEWTDATWSPTTGCDRTSDGCDHCYALTLAKRLKAMGSAKYQTDGDPKTSGPGFGVAMHATALALPMTWRAPRKIFVNSMSDLFHAKITDEFIAQVFAVMAACPQHVFQVLTKRHARMRSLLNSPAFGEMVWRAFTDLDHPGKDWETAERLIGDRQPGTVMRPIPWVHLGVSVEDQHWADIRIPALLDTPAAVRWISAEPLLGPVDLSRWLTYTCAYCGKASAWTDGMSRRLGDERDEFWCQKCGVESPLEACTPPGIGWVVVGGESGAGARPMHPAWARTLRDQCAQADVPFLFKQWGDWGPAPFIVRVCDPSAGWQGTEEELAAAKAQSEAAGATHVHTGHWYLENGERVWSIHEIGHKPWSLERVGLPDGMEPIRRWGKKRAGRELDGREHNGYPRLSVDAARCVPEVAA